MRVNVLEKVAVARKCLRNKHKMTDFAEPVWKAQRPSGDQSVVITPCVPVDIRLRDVTIMWEPSSFVEDTDRKNLYVELSNPNVRAYLQRQEEALGTECWGQVSSCLAKEGKLRCKISMRNVRTFDTDRRACATPTRFAGMYCNVLVKLIGKWQTPDGSAMGLNLQATDVQVIHMSTDECPF